MKKSQLRNIIRESIKQLINEQPMLNEGTMNATVCTCGGYKTTTTFFNPAGSTGPCMTPNNPFPSSTNTPDQQGNPQYAVGTWNGGGGAGCNSGYSYTTYFANDMPTTGNTEYTWFDQVHDDVNGNCIPNPIDCGEGTPPPNEDKGCTDPNALNNGECCNGDPACTVIGSNNECCEYDRGSDDPCDKANFINYITTNHPQFANPAGYEIAHFCEKCNENQRPGPSSISGFDPMCKCCKKKPIKDPKDPQIDRMNTLAFRGKR